MADLRVYNHGLIFVPGGPPRHVIPTIDALRRAANLLNEAAIALRDGDGFTDRPHRTRHGTNEKTLAVALALIGRACGHGGGIGALPVVDPSDLA